MTPEARIAELEQENARLRATQIDGGFLGLRNEIDRLVGERDAVLADNKRATDHLMRVMAQRDEAVKAAEAERTRFLLLDVVLQQGQCDDKRPSAEWHNAADAAIAAVATKEGRTSEQPRAAPSKDF